MKTHTELLRQALEALEGLKSIPGGRHELHELNAIHRKHERAITEITEYFAQPAPVPLTLWTEAQHERAYRNSPELHKDVKSLAAFKRVAKEVAAMYGITKGQP
jgi:hypothetical protein